MTVTLMINNVVYILDSIDMLPKLADRMPSKTNETPLMSGETAGEVQVSTVQETNSTSRLRVLFVEDNDYIRDLTLCLLEAPNREVSAFGSAEEALAQFKHRPFDVLITDINLPKMSGIELAKRALALQPETWVIVASGYQLPPDIEKLGKHVRAMTKPFESDQIDAIFAEIGVGRGLPGEAVGT
jgi:CheY-like chemotaxis protein